MSPTQPDLPSVRGARVFIVEDESIIAKDIEISLKGLGYRVCGSADTGSDAVVEVGRTKPDVVLMDIRLRGDMDGIEAARRVYEQFRTPVVFLTAYADEPTLRRAEATLPFGYILKPFEERDLHVALVMALCRHKAYAEVEQKVQERTQELARSEERYRLLVESVKDYAIFMLDPGGRVISWSSGAESIKGYKAQEILGKHFSCFYPEEERSAGRPERLLSAASAEGRAEEEGWRVRKDGTRFWADVVITAVRDEAGQPRGFSKVVRDLTPRKQMEEALRDALRAREDFLAIASHELKTPLAALLMQVQGLERSAPLGELSPKLRERLSKASAAGLRLEKLIDEMLDVSRITAGRLKLEPESFNLDEAVREVVDRFAEPAMRANVSVAMRLQPGVTGSWDRARLDQVVTNLLSNAIKYGKGKPVEVEVRTEAGHAIVQIRDQGIGIAPDQQRKIFERFERALATREYGGLGLGLWIVRQIVEASGGHIEVQSAPGRGATFTVRLPLRLQGGVLHALQ